MEDNITALHLASEAGHILLENGAEIERVEDTMQRIAHHYGADDGNFFVISNGIISTGQGYADAKFIPLKGAHLDKVAAVNQVSREVSQNKLTLPQLSERLAQIRQMPDKAKWEQILGCTLGAGFFSIIFGGSLLDCAAAGLAGFFLWIFMAFVAQPHLSRILGNICGGLLSATVCILCYKLGFGEHLGNMIIGAIIPLVPGVPFTNGIRDIGNEDYLAGTTRLLDAFMMFLCIAAGVMVAFLLDGHIEDGIIALQGMQVDPRTYAWGWQIAAAMIGTTSFAILFGVPREYYLGCGITGTIGWIVYLAMLRWCGLSLVESTFFGAMAVLLTSRGLATTLKCPATLFLVCGIFPLVPGGGLFWTSYYLVSEQLHLALAAGFLSLKITVAIALGIIIVNEVSHLKKTHTTRRKTAK